MKKPMIFEWREHFEREHRKYFPYEIKSLTTFGESFEDNAYKHPKNPVSEFCFNIHAHDNSADKDFHMSMNMNVEEAAILMKQLKSFIDYNSRRKKTRYNFYS